MSAKERLDAAIEVIKALSNQVRNDKERAAYDAALDTVSDALGGLIPTKPG